MNALAVDPKSLTDGLQLYCEKSLFCVDAVPMYSESDSWRLDAGYRKGSDS